MNYKEYAHVNNQVSSEMFYSLMAILHMQLPVAQNFFRLKRKYRLRRRDTKQTDSSSSRIRMIASPKMMVGLSLPGNIKKTEPKTTKAGDNRKFTFPDFPSHRSSNRITGTPGETYR